MEDNVDMRVRITDGITSPSEGCAVEKGGGLTEVQRDKVAAGGGGNDAKVDPMVSYAGKFGIIG